MPAPRTLVLGGTQFVGRHIVETLLDRGHDVTILNRGRSADALPPVVERLRGDRDAGADGMHAVTGRRWNACIDVSGYTVPHVRASAEALAASIDRYVFVSTIAAHADLSRGPVREDDARVPPADADVTDVNATTYGPLKVAGEDLVTEIYGDRATILRPQIITGPHDPFDRVSYWIRRAGEAADGGPPMLAPGDGSDHVQFVDVRDIAAFTAEVVAGDRSGRFGLGGPRSTWRSFIADLGDPPVTWTDAERLTARLASPFELPLYQRAGGAWCGLFDVDTSAAEAAGFTTRPRAETLADLRAWMSSLEPNQGPERALSREREAELLSAESSSS